MNIVMAHKAPPTSQCASSPSFNGLKTVSSFCLTLTFRTPKRDDSTFCEGRDE